MCRWIAYIGETIFMDTLVTRPNHSLVKQSLNAKMRFRADGSILATNGDGFGLGWYNHKDEPGLYKVSDPAWSNENIHEICSQTRGRIFMAHIREATMGEVQRSNTHPFKHGNWLFQHNGDVHGFEHIRRDLQFDVNADLYPLIKGNTDSETLFFLALSYGLESSPKIAMEKTIRRVKQACEDNNILPQMTLSTAMSDGNALYTTRYAIGLEPNSQYYATHEDSIMEMNDSNTKTKLPAGSVVVVSEPLDHNYEHWKEMPMDSFATVKDGRIDIEALDVS